MTDLQRRAFKAGYDGMLLSQFMVGVPDKDRRTASIYFAKGVIKKNKERRDEIQRERRGPNPAVL